MIQNQLLGLYNLVNRISRKQQPGKVTEYTALQGPTPFPM